MSYDITYTITNSMNATYLLSPLQWKSNATGQ